MPDTVRVTFDRASVAMGDDVDSHREFFDYPAACTVDDLLVDVATRLLPAVAGAAGWCLYADMKDPHRRRLLGLIYTRDDLGAEDWFCRYQRDGPTLGVLAPAGELGVYGHCLTWGAARPVTLTEVRADHWYTVGRGTRLGPEAAEQSRVNWQRVREADR